MSFAVTLLSNATIIVVRFRTITRVDRSVVPTFLKFISSFGLGGVWSPQVYTGTDDW